MLYRKLKEKGGIEVDSVTNLIYKITAIASETYILHGSASEWEGKTSTNPWPNAKKGWEKRARENVENSTHSKKKNKTVTGGGGKSNPDSKQEKRQCHMCGSIFHLKAACNYKSHPSANKSSLPWPESEMGKLCKEKCKTDYLLWSKKADGSPSGLRKLEKTGEIPYSLLFNLQSTVTHRLEH
jgi:hypothetical protein